ncbi:MAG: FAD-dependent oxidoreductase [bacterium]|nr:FAD-dependent oxidoreductase [bacterium]
MTRDPRYDILFEPLAIGPVTAPNRFYQVPHCNGMGRVYPNAMIGMRGAKAEGGWGIVCTEQCDFLASGDASPYAETNMWDASDEVYLGRMVEEVHRYGSLAGIELVHNGHDTPNLYSREIPIGPMHRPMNWSLAPIQARAMDLEDIREYRRAHRRAAIRARDIGFDIVIVYAGHDGTVPSHFLARRHNQRTDEYGGSLENRLRLFRELLEETREAVGDTTGVVVRFAVDEMMGPDGLEWHAEGREAVEMMAELPDLWDVNVSDWSNDSKTSRFAPEGYQEDYVAFVKQVTTKPVSTVGRYTSPDAMVSAIRRGIVDLIGAARPSIADPFLPKKVEEGRLDDIRECIGCNVCIGWTQMTAPARCTQNPTFSEEWRKSWHPETLPPAESDAHVLVVGAGPAGLEAARAAGLRGFRVTLAEAEEELGGRVTRESRLPGLAAWARVRDYRMSQIQRMPNVDVYRSSRLGADQVLELGADHVAIATGATWRRDGCGRRLTSPVPGSDAAHVLTPDDILEGRRPPEGRVLLFDDDHYYMASVLAELLSTEGYDVSLATPMATVASWLVHTLEHEANQERLHGAGVDLHANTTLLAVEAGQVLLHDSLRRREVTLPVDSVVMVTARLPEDGLYHDIVQALDGSSDTGIRTLSRIGDCQAPGIIATAVYEGHRYARELGTDIDPGDVPFRRELHVIEPAMA